MESLVLKPSEVGKALSVGRSLVYELIARGEIPSVKVGRCIRIPRASLEKWIKEHEKTGIGGADATKSSPV